MRTDPDIFGLLYSWHFFLTIFFRAFSSGNNGGFHFQQRNVGHSHNIPMVLDQVILALVDRLYSFGRKEIKINYKFYSNNQIIIW